MKELIEILKENLSPNEIVELLNSVNFNQKDIDNYTIENMICPKCCSELVIHRWMEDRGEYFGFPAEEEMVESRCNYCGWGR